MARFYPLYVRRSDGRKETIGKGRMKEQNEPTDAQLDQRPDKNGISDFYREVGPDDMKHMDWRRKLGGMMARELGWKDKVSGDTSCILVEFPEDYRLYEHIKKTVKDGQTEVKTKTHAGGGNDRQDAYLYGHPQGRRKRFRSPADFFPHLLWLTTDESGDPDNCGCKICSPEDIETALPNAKVAKAVVKQETEKKPSPVPASVLPARQASMQSMPQRPQSIQNALRPSIPAPLPPARSADQQEDRRYGAFMYRPGEIVWFKRMQAWGLGMVSRRWKSHSNPPQLSYTIQPLSYPSGPSVPVTKSSDHEMRPWLAWSVPQFTHPGLNNLTEPPRFENADWEAMRQQRYGPGGDLEVDGSILAAKSVDASYTPVNPSKTTDAEPGVTETHYDGIFIGAEKIWLGEPIRLVPGSGTDIMVVHAIIEHKRTAAITNQPLHQTLTLTGDIYTLISAPHSDPTKPSPASMAANPALPQRLTEDLGYRNMHSIHIKRSASYWKLLASQSRIDLDAVKGRWYEATRLIPILQDEQKLKDFERAGDIPEASLFMNARGDCLNANRLPTLPAVPRFNVRRPDRRAALGRAVPGDVQIKHEGVEPPASENIDPALSSSSGVVDDPVEIDPRFETAQDGGLEDFMDLDGGEGLPGFGREYGGQSQGFY